MKKYRVQFKANVLVNIDVEAENKEDAIDKAWEIGPYLDSYVGNGGSDKIIGVREDNMSVESGEGFETSESDVYEIE